MSRRIRGRPAHTPGPTYLAQTPDATKVITAGLNNAVRVFTIGSDAEPVTIDNCPESNYAVAATNDFFLLGSEDGTVSKYSLRTHQFEDLLVRCSLPVRDIAITPDGKWAAVASDELVIKVVRTDDQTQLHYLREQQRPIKHVTFDPKGVYLTASGTDGTIYVYSFEDEKPTLIHKIEGVINRLDTTSESSSRAVWHPDGRFFGAPTSTREFQVVSKDGWRKGYAFQDGLLSDITAAVWSSNGLLLATACVDHTLSLWDFKSRKIISTYPDNEETILSMAWHPTENILLYTNNYGELYIHDDFVSKEFLNILQQPLQTRPTLNDQLPTRTAPNGQRSGQRDNREDSADAVSDIFFERGDGEGDFIDDDDGAGYAEPSKKRSNGHLGTIEPKLSKRPSYAAWEPQIHEPFQPSSTPFRGDRRYLCLNLVGVVWTVAQDENYNSVSVEFYDRELGRDFHFTDPSKYDKACLNEHGTLLSSPLRDDEPAQIFYRPHETWTVRTDWRTQLPRDEDISAIALSDSYIVALTSANYVRVYTLFGTPYRVYRQKSTTAVTCTAWRNYVLTIGNGAVGADGSAQLVYALENVRRDEVFQSGDVVALSPDSELQTVFFSDAGDPCIYDTTGVLSILLHWRTPGQARWVPLLDTTQLERLASGRKEETYWPVAVAQERFHCIILKGGDKYPYFPRPLLSEFDFKIPIGQSSSGAEAQTLEHGYMLNSVMYALLEDLVSNSHASHSQKAELTRRELDIDKALLQLLAIECREGDERGMKALETVQLMRDQSGRMLEAAQKVASRYGRDVLGEKIRELAERRLVGLAADDDDLN